MMAPYWGLGSVSRHYVRWRQGPSVALVAQPSPGSRMYPLTEAAVAELRSCWLPILRPGNELGALRGGLSQSRAMYALLRVRNPLVHKAVYLHHARIRQ